MTATILDALKAISAYPIPLRTLYEVCIRRKLDETAEATKEALATASYNLAVADLLLWLALAPDISQGGQSFGFTDEQRDRLRARAQKLLGQYADETEAASAASYGYKGSRL